MTRAEKQRAAQHVKDVQRCYDAVRECANMGEALATLTDTAVAMIKLHMETKTDRALLMGACIKRLREYRKEIEK